LPKPTPKKLKRNTDIHLHAINYTTDLRRRLYHGKHFDYLIGMQHSRAFA